MRSITKAARVDRKEKGLRIELWDTPKLRNRQDKEAAKETEAAASEVGRKLQESGVLKAK